MPLSENLQNKLHCICSKMVHFEIIDDIECDWGSHTVIQCPKCEELFSIDCECPAFQSILKLSPFNEQLFSDKEKSNYLKDSHPN